MKKLLLIVGLMVGMISSQLVYGQTVNVTTNPTQICAGQGTPVTLEAVTTGGVDSTYLWTPGGQTAQSITVSPFVTTTYSVTVIFTDSTTATATSTVTVNPLPIAVINPAAPSICFGDGTVLSASGGGNGGTYLWLPDGQTVASIIVSPTISTTYQVMVTNANGCTSATAVTVTVNPLPNAVVNPASASICPGEAVTLIANGGTNYLWNTGATTASITMTPNVTTTYSVDVTDANGCSATVSSTVTPYPNPIANITPSGPTIFCQGNSVALTANSSSAYVWAPGGQTTQSISVSVSGNYSVTVTDANGCTASSAPTTITVNPLPTIVITPSGSTTFCQGGTVTLVANGASSYLWSNGATTQSITVSVSGNYSVTGIDGNSCQATSAVTTVTVNPLPTATISPSGQISFCQGGSTTLNASIGINYLWSPGGQTTQSITVSVSGVYSVIVTDGNGCSATSAATTVIVNLPPNMSITPNGPTTFCQGGSVTFTSSPANTYLWAPGGQTTQSITVSAAGNYLVTGTNGYGCSASSAASTVTVNPLPTPSVSSNGPTTFCQGESVTLTSSPASSYGWLPGGQTTPSITVSMAGSYSVVVTDGNGCSGTSGIIAVNVNPLPIIVVTPNGQTTFCQGGFVTFLASGASSYVWAPGGQTTPSINVSIAGNYSATGTDIYGCVGASMPVTVNVIPLPTVIITPNGPTTFCDGDEITLTASGASTYVWDNGETINPITVSIGGSYSVTGTDGNGCSAMSAPTVVTVMPMPADAGTITGPTTVCEGTTVVYTTNIILNATSYVWSVPVGATIISGQGTQNITLVFGNAGGNISVYGQNSLCSGQPSNIAVTVNAAPSLVVTASPPTICVGQSSNLFAGGNGTIFAWSNGEITQTINVSPIITSLYTVNVTGSNGCSTNDAITVSVNPLPSVTVNPSSANSCGGVITITANTSTNSTYQWYMNNILMPAETAQDYWANQSGSFMVVATDSFGCSASATSTITVNPLPVVNLTLTQDQFCTDVNSAVISGGSPAGGTYSGVAVFGGNTVYPPVTGVGTYTVTYTVTDGNGCSNAATDLLTINPVPAVSFFSIVGSVTTSTPPFDLMTSVSPTGGNFWGPGVNGSFFYPDSAGVGSHMITYSWTNTVSWCEAHQIQYVNVGSGVGIGENAAVNAVNIFPNPANDLLNIAGIDLREITSLKVMNLLGEVVMTMKPNTNDITINISDFSSGMYLISFMNANGIAGSKHFMKE